MSKVLLLASRRVGIKKYHPDTEYTEEESREMSVIFNPSKRLDMDY
jgi:hypothetical protein